MKRYLQKNVETLSARLIVGDQVKAGDTIEIYVEHEPEERLAARTVSY